MEKELTVVMGLLLCVGCVPAELTDSPDPSTDMFSMTSDMDSLPDEGDTKDTNPDTLDMRVADEGLPDSGDPDTGGDDMGDPFEAIARGRDLFMNNMNNCVGCHKIDGTGGNNASNGVALSDSLGNHGEAGVLVILKEGVEGTIMQGYEESLTSMQLNDLLAFIVSLAP